MNIFSVIYIQDEVYFCSLLIFELINIIYTLKKIICKLCKINKFDGIPL